MNLLLNNIKKIIRNEFFNASIWVFLATGTMSVGNYFYHLLMGRMLGPESYGVLESTISFLYILSVPFNTLTLIIVKFVSAYKGKQDYKSISGFYFYLRKNLFIFGLIATLIIL
jgi:O-antigen/teichoic acid export membrane protein